MRFVEVAVDLVGLLVAVALLRHARRPLLEGLHHALVREDALVELVELALQRRQDLGAAEDALASPCGCSRRASVKSPLSTAAWNVAPGLSPHSARS